MTLNKTNLNPIFRVDPNLIHILWTFSPDLGDVEMVKEQYYEADVCKKISEIQFSIFSPDDIAKQSHIQVQQLN